jgi:hypothetical protein
MWMRDVDAAWSGGYVTNQANITWSLNETPPRRGALVNYR